MNTRITVSILLLAILVLAPMSSQAATERRIALVLGNGAYEHVAALPNPANDARAMSEKFRSMGFETVEGYDLGYDDLRDTMRAFARQARDSDIAVVFYAGHGIAVNGMNYIVPVDASLDDPVDWEFQVYPIDDVLRTMRHSDGVNLVLLDACRDNPLAEVLASSMGTTARSIGSRGLTPIDPDTEGQGMAIAFATSPGEVAEDGQGQHSPFTNALLKHIGAANTSFSEVMGHVTGEVYNSTDQRQRPWLNSSLTGSVYLNPVEEIKQQDQQVTGLTENTAPVSSNMESMDVQKLLFETAKDSNDPADYQSYLDVFPQGIFAGPARNAIARLTSGDTPVQVAALTPDADDLPNAEDVDAASAIHITRTLSQPLVLEVTDYVKSKPSNRQSEQLLFLDRELKIEIQNRLNAASISVGRADGDFGNRTRAGIRTFQQRHGIPASGYLNDLQLNLLMADTDASYRAMFTVSRGRNGGAVAQRPTAASSQSAGTTSSPAASDAFSNFVNGFATGLGQGIGHGLTN